MSKEKDISPSKYDRWYDTQYRVYHSSKDCVPDVFCSEKPAKEHALALYRKGRHPVWIMQMDVIEIYENDTDIKTSFGSINL